MMDVLPTHRAKKSSLASWSRLMGILKSGGQVDYEGASNVTFTDVGEAAGSYKELVVKDGKFETVKIR